MRSACHIVAYTGAGISTACGIPDFRGPNGVWTAQRRGLPMPRARVSFLYAQPSLTHMALLGLMQAGKLPHICSQNVDSLHLRSGVPRSQLSELHGNCFAERCPACAREYVRDFEMDSVSACVCVWVVVQCPPPAAHAHSTASAPPVQLTAAAVQQDCCCRCTHSCVCVRVCATRVTHMFDTTNVGHMCDD